MIDITTLYLLGRSVSQCRHNRSRRGERHRIVQGASDTEVGDQHSVFFIANRRDKDVGGFDVAVPDAGAVCVVEAARDLTEDVHRSGHRNRSLRKDLRQVSTVDVLHGQPRLVLFDAAIMDRDDVAVIEVCDMLGFAFEPGGELAVAQGGVVQDLQRVPARQPWMASHVDRTHATGTEHTLDPVSSENRPPFEHAAKDSQHHIPTSSYRNPNSHGESTHKPGGTTLAERSRLEPEPSTSIRVMSDGGTPASGQNLAVVPETVREVGKYVYELAEALRTALDTAAKEVTSLTDGSWTGDAAAEFSEGWTEVRDGGTQIMTALTGMAEKLGVTAATYQASDESRAAVLGTASSSLDLP